MATLTIRNLPNEIRDALRREAAMHNRSMEEEARQTLASRYRPRLSPEEVMKRIAEFNAEHPHPADAKMSASESVIASKRIDALYEEGLISLEEKRAWDSRIDAYSVRLDEVEEFFRKTWPWYPKQS
ncbi:MAG TPA: hypothetical protein VHD95_03730 [Rhizomicrobium sp.]|jgi:plasmid stability protein|nr:hypothetical protein [Rhizomicrobium sp.]